MTQTNIHLDGETASSAETAERAPVKRIQISKSGLLCVLVCAVGIAFVPMMGAYLAIVSALVIVHEGAHMFFARRGGLVVEEYAVGFGPRVISLHTNQMVWSIRGIPAGGFVKIAGATSATKVPAHIKETETLRGCSRKVRVKTILAGPVSNLILAVVLSTVAFGVVGAPGANGDQQRLPLNEAVTSSVEDTVSISVSTVSALGTLIVHADDYAAAVGSGQQEDAPAAFLSPVGAGNILSDLDELWLVLRFAAIISASLGVFNLLPVPPLDGGHLMVEAIEMFKSWRAGKRVKLSLRSLNIATGVTLAFMLVLTVTSLRFDLVG